MDNLLHFQVLSEKILPQAADPSLVAYCPSMDLVALTTIDQQVLIYRLNGQRVYGATQKAGNLRVERIQWKPNGQLLAIAWSDGSVRLISAESTKVVHQFATGIQPGQVSSITCMKWTTNLMSGTSSTALNWALNWSHLFQEEDTFATNQASLDLPRDLALIDIEPALPKLSPLPAGAGSEDVFSSRASLDTLFRPFNPKDNEAVDVMVVGTKEGDIHLSIYDSFVIGSFVSPFKDSSSPYYLALQASHPQYSTHSLLLKSSTTERMCFATMDLPFISTSSKYLSVLASRSTALQNLLRYIHQVQVLMASEWKSTQELPSRFLRNINETLQEKGNRNVVECLYHAVATGHTYPEVKEWLVDELSERGHKRWDKAVTTGLEAIKRLVHENMMPALERCSLILSRFSGIAKFQGPNDTVGFTVEQIVLLENTVACLQLLSSKLLIQVVDELDLFASFSAWLRYEIDRLASDTPASPNDDAAEREASIDHGKVLLYLQTAMTGSPLAAYFEEPSPEVGERWREGETGQPTFDLLHEQMRRRSKGLPVLAGSLRVETHCKLLSLQANTIFAQIAEAERANVSFGESGDIGTPQKDSPMDMRMSSIKACKCRSHIAYIPKDHPNSVQVVQVGFSVILGRSMVDSIDTAGIQLGGGKVLDIKFWDDSVLLILWESEEKTLLLSVPYSVRKAAGTEISFTDDFSLEYKPHVPSSGFSSPSIFTDQLAISTFSKFNLPIDESFIPAKIEIREGSRPNEKHDTRRVILLAKDKFHYKVFSIASRSPAILEADPDVVMG